jgi:hypothetical protein
VPVEIVGPRRDAIGRLASGLHVACYLRRNPSGRVVSVLPELVSVADRLIAAGAFGLASESASWQEAAAVLLPVA